MARVSIVDVVTRASVSKSPVSRGLIGKRSISEENRQRMHQAVEALGYRPEPVAQRPGGLWTELGDWVWVMLNSTRQKPDTLHAVDA